MGCWDEKSGARRWFFRIDLTHSIRKILRVWWESNHLGWIMNHRRYSTLDTHGQQSSSFWVSNEEVFRIAMIFMLPAKARLRKWSYLLLRRSERALLPMPTVLAPEESNTSTSGKERAVWIMLRIEHDVRLSRPLFNSCEKVPFHYQTSTVLWRARQWGHPEILLQYRLARSVVPW